MEVVHKSHKKLLALLFTGVLMGALDISIVGPALSAIERSLNVDKLWLAWVISIYLLFNLVGIPLFAKLSDVFGRRIIYIIAVSIFALGSLIVALSHDITMLLIGRSVQGFGASGIFPVASAVVGDVFHPEKRGRILGMIGAVFGIAFIVGPLMASIMLKFFSWNVLFLINLPIAAFIIIGSLKTIPDNKIESTKQFDWKGIILFGLILGLFSYGINQINPNDFYQSLLSLRVYSSILISLVLLLLFIRVEKNAEIPVVKIDIFLKKQIRLVVLISVATGIVQAFFMFVPKFAEKAFMVSNSRAAMMMLPIVMGIAIGSPTFGRLIDKIGSRLVLFIGLILVSIGFVILHFVSNNVPVFYASGALIGLGLSIPSGSSLRYIMLNENRSIDRASTQGLVTVFISIGQIFGSIVLGVMIASNPGIDGYKLIFSHIAVLIFVMTLFALRLKNHKQELETANKVAMNNEE